VDEVEVEDLDAEALHRGVEGRGHARVVVVPDLRRDEDVVAVDLAAPEDPADALLVAVDPRGVDVAVAGVERTAEGGVDGGVRDLPDTEADLRDREARR